MFSDFKDAAKYSLLDEEQKRFQHPNSKSDSRKSIAHWTLHALSILAVIAVAAYAITLQRRSLAICALRHNTWSPALDVRNDETEDLTFMGTFGAKTPFKGPPNPEVTAAWDQIWDYNTVNISAESMMKMGRSLDSIQYPPEFGGGYLAQVEAVHHMHCLYAIWRDHHLPYFPVDVNLKKDRPAYYERHYEHCVDIIRQRLMCTADPGLVTFRWVENEEIPEPDFNTPHVCQRFDRLLQWNRENEASVEVNDIKWKKPKDAVTVPVAP